MSTLIVGGALANKANNGGEAWVRLSWVRGFQELGHRVLFLEQIAPEACVDANGAVVPFAESVNLAYFRRVTEEFGLAGASALILGDGEQTHGLPYDEVLAIAAGADLLVNISGHLTLEAIKGRLRRRAFVDIDPGFTQFWHAAGDAGAHLDGHDLWFTIGENVGTADCSIPTGGIDWRPIRQPVVLADWPVRNGPLDRFTTVANWRGPYGVVEYDGRTFGLKVHEFRKVIELPQRSRQAFELALAIHPADSKDLTALRDNGWKISDPISATATPDDFRRYVQGSGAEFSVAQGVYVDTGSGWFSDRTVRYLASGKPALVQDTGFSRTLPVGEGLVPFRTLDEAAAGAEAIARDYERHCRAARALAEEHFAAERVLGHLLEEVGIAS